MAIQKGVFDPDLIIDAWFDPTQQSTGWFDEDLVESAASSSIAGTATVAFSSSAILTGTGALSGASTSLFTTVATLGGGGTMSGGVSFAFDTTATLTGVMSGAMSGAASMALTAVATLTGHGALAGAVPLSFTTEAALAGSGAMAGTGAMSFEASGTLSAAVIKRPSTDHGAWWPDKKKDKQPKPPQMTQREWDRRVDEIIAKFETPPPPKPAPRLTLVRAVLPEPIPSRQVRPPDPPPPVSIIGRLSGSCRLSFKVSPCLLGIVLDDDEVLELLLLVA